MRLVGYRSDLNRYWGTMQGLTIASDQTMRASLFLVGDRRLVEQAEGGPGAFPGQGIVLQRGLFEILANVMTLSEEPRTRDHLFRADGYRERFRRLRDLEVKHRGTHRWKAPLDREANDLDRLARWLRLSSEEAAKPTKLRWPSLEAMKTANDPHGRPWLSGSRRAVLTSLYSDSYGADSRVVHQKDIALHYAMRQEQGFSQTDLAEIRNISVFRALTFEAAILTEVDHALAWPTTVRLDLRQAWDVLVPGFDPAAEIHALRYRDLLA